MPKSDFQSQYSTSKSIRNFLIFFSLKNMNLGTPFLLLTFLVNINWHLPVTPICKIWWFHLTTVDFLAKTFLILYPSLENHTTNITITIHRWCICEIMRIPPPFLNSILAFLSKTCIFIFRLMLTIVQLRQNYSDIDSWIKPLVYTSWSPWSELPKMS